MDARHAIATGQGWYFFGTGLWPLVQMPSFEAVTGPKPEAWLVRTVGGLLAILGLGLVVAGRRSRVEAPIPLVAAASSGFLAGIDVWYGGVRRRISPVYLLDAVVELGLVGAWVVTRETPQPRGVPSGAGGPQVVATP